jgi:D-alanyl-D-alanine carboxypeptidase (penicillin-binding protein 5/6)
MAAGRTLVTCAERDGARYVCVTLNDPDDWDDHKALYDWAFANYSFAEVIPAGLSYEVPLISGAEMTAPAETEGAAYALIQNGESYDMELELPAFAFAPISEGERAGRAVACSDGQEIASVRIVYSEDVEVDRELKLTPGERFLRFWVLTGLSAPFYLE